jgi:hypothetical protein
MSPCAQQIFQNITPDRWAAFQVTASQHNIKLSSNSGQATQQGFTFSWAYNSSEATLMIQCLDHPFGLTCGMINGRLHELIDGILAGPGGLAGQTSSL